jgi:hypothetical protein
MRRTLSEEIHHHKLRTRFFKQDVELNLRLNVPYFTRRQLHAELFADQAPTTELVHN